MKKKEVNPQAMEMGNWITLQVAKGRCKEIEALLECVNSRLKYVKEYVKSLEAQDGSTKRKVSK